MFFINSGYKLIIGYAIICKYFPPDANASLMKTSLRSFLVSVTEQKF